MKKRTDIGSGSEEISRRDFLKQSFGLFAAVALPSVLLSKCAYYRDKPQNAAITTNDGGTIILPAGTPYISFEITFSKPINKTTFTNAVSISPSIGDLSLYTPEWTSDSVVFCKFPLSEKGKTYTVTIAGSVKDSSGLSLDGNSDGTGGDAYSFDITATEAVNTALLRKKDPALSPGLFKRVERYFKGAV